MKHISIGGLDVSRIGLGAMSMSGYYNIGAGSDAKSIHTIHRALDLGVTHLDTAEIYGPFTNEELVGRAIKDRREDRKSTRLNSSHSQISYAVFCLKKKKIVERLNASWALFDPLR